MKPVADYATVRSGVFVWQGYEPAVKCDCSSSALETEAGLIFIDPIPLAEEALQELLEESSLAPAAVLLTSGNHQRESLVLAGRFGIPVIVPKDAGEDLVAKERLISGDTVLGLQSIALPGFGPGETAFLHDGVLIFGDALVNLEPEGLFLLPEKYRIDKKEALRSLEALQGLSPEILLFAHGTPIVQNAVHRLSACLAESL
jgi:glyoxylase-like metal-dependent hydrolase (beta-lactamase superfamily II)